MTLGGVAVDVAAGGVAPEDAVLGDAGWQSIAGLAAAVVAVLALFSVGVLLPYYVNDLHRLPLAEIANLADDPQRLWPQDGWRYPVGLAALVTTGFAPLVLLAVVFVGAVWLTALWRRSEPERVPRSLALIVIMTGSVAALLFWFSEPGLALAAWRRD